MARVIANTSPPAARSHRRRRQSHVRAVPRPLPPPAGPVHALRTRALLLGGLPRRRVVGLSVGKRGKHTTCAAGTVKRLIHINRCAHEAKSRASHIDDGLDDDVTHAAAALLQVGLVGLVTACVDK